MVTMQVRDKNRVQAACFDRHLPHRELNPLAAVNQK
jgi:hypothetical protein